MSYLKTIEFLVKEVAKKDQEINELGIALDHEVSRCKDLRKISDERLEEVVIKDDQLGDAEANLHWVEEKLAEAKEELKQMTIEKDHWKEEALDYRNRKELEWWSQEKQYKDEIEKLKSSIVSINQDRIKVVGKLEDEVSRYRADYLAESDYVHSQEEEIGKLNRKIQELKDKNSRDWATDFAYQHLKKAYDDNNSYYEERIAKLQVELNHLKNNK